MSNQFKSFDFLPEVFKTPTNEQFLGSTLDVLAAQPDIKRVEGYIGKRYGYSTSATGNHYVQEASSERQSYQLQPSVVLLNPENGKPRDFISYTGILDSLKLEGLPSDISHSKLFENEFYNLDTFTDYDKLANFSQYHWIPYGPDSIPLTINPVYSEATITIEKTEQGVFVNGEKYTESVIYLVRNGKYVFNIVNSTDSKFYIQRAPGKDAITQYRDLSTQGLVSNNNGLQSGEITFFVQEKTPIGTMQDELYYQFDDSDSYGVIKLIETPYSAVYDVNTIIGRKNYLSFNGVDFTNGLHISFANNVTQDEYKNKTFFVEGVGSAIQLIPSEVYSSVTQDTTVPDYITIHRASDDQNYWSRTNRWFHEDVLATNRKHLGYVSLSEINKPILALRPILEYKKNLKLFNSGVKLHGTVDLLDNIYTNVFSQLEGKLLSGITIDGKILADGDTVVFKNESNPDIRKKVYKVYVARDDANNELVKLQYIVDVDELGTVNINQGTLYSGTSWVLSSSFVWNQAQKKQYINQYPLFDVFNKNGISFGDSSVFTNTTFTGSSLFAYETSSGVSDVVLGFPIKYSSVENHGDIIFRSVYNTQKFTYVDDGEQVSQPVNMGYVHQYSDTEITKLVGWTKFNGNSIQYQVFEFDNTTNDVVNTFKCDVRLKYTTNIANNVVYLNDEVLDISKYTIEVLGNNTVVTTDVQAGSKLTVMLISDDVSSKGYFEYPINLENNPLNESITTLALGDIRKHYRTIFSNCPETSGSVFGSNNLHNIDNINQYGTSIIQSSSSLVLPGVFLRSPQANIFNSLQFNNEQYKNYKSLIIDLADKGNYTFSMSPADILDDIILSAAATKSTGTSFYWSDMLFNGTPYQVNTYKFNSTIYTVSLPLSDIWETTIDSVANFKAIGVYITTNGYTRQLTKNVEYVIDSQSPSVTLNLEILEGSVITVKEYNKTYGSYCPNTPSKLGLYPKFAPEVLLLNQQTTPTYFIRGHDGSLTKLYGNYDKVTGKFDDIRDLVTIEFEKRIFNNIKVSSNPALKLDDILPGQFRNTGVTWEQYISLYQTEFLNWVGENSIDYKTQLFTSTNQFKYNYNQSQSRVDNNPLKQGYWKGIYRWYYDTETPDITPWEMLGLTVKPLWWDSRYGIHPYTSGNTLMWEDIANGYVWNNGEPYINHNRVRAGLLNCLPVDIEGKLLSPLNSVVSQYNKLTFERDWSVGDCGPAESSFLNSSAWPFSVMKLFVLTKPAKFFNLFADVDRYTYNSDIGQYLFDGTSRLNPSKIEVNGKQKPKHSYINWVVDFVNSQGEDGTDFVTSLLSNVDVRLTYNMGGFTSKKNTKFFVERATPNSRNNSLLIPDENYNIMLYNNPPKHVVQLSSVVVQKAKRGWVVWGNSKAKHYFTTSVPKLGKYATKTVGNKTVKISTQFYDGRTQVVPYGHTFYSLESVCEFLNNYSNYLKTTGVVFELTDGTNSIDWHYVIDELLLWGQQNWTEGSLVSLNPCSRTLKISNENLVVQPALVGKSNFILNQNLTPIDSKDMFITRSGNDFEVKITSADEVIAYSSLKLDNIEHAVIFDNYTTFNDSIYIKSTGLRHERMILKGSKTNNWHGFIDANGFILNENNVQEWTPNKKYTKNIIVTYKGNFYTANRVIEPSTVFNENDWTLSDYTDTKDSILPNISSLSYESSHYYDTTSVNLENDTSLLSYSLIGFRPRAYLTAPDLTDTTQINVFKTILDSKGTSNAGSLFDGTVMNRSEISYSIKENWAIKQGDFGNTRNANFVEVQLDNTLMAGNSTLIGFSDGTNSVDSSVNQVINISDFVNFEFKPKSANVLPKLKESKRFENAIPSAGFVNLEDTKIQEFTIDDLLKSKEVSTLYRNNHVWVANQNGTWDIYVAATLNSRVTQIDNNLNGTVKVTFSNYHRLQPKDLIAIINFDTRIDGFYRVKSVNNLKSLTVELSLPVNINRIQGIGAVLKLVSRKFDEVSDIADANIANTEWNQRQYWVNNDVDGNWAVYNAQPNFNEEITYIGQGKLGTSVAYSPLLGSLTSDNNGKIFRFFDQTVQVVTGGKGNSDYKAQIKLSDTMLFCSSPVENKIYVYKHNSYINQMYLFTEIDTSENLTTLTGALAVSKNGSWLFASDFVTQEVAVYHLNQNTSEFDFAYKLVDSSVPTGSHWGYSIAVSTDGVKLVVGAPRENTNNLHQAGAAYVYSRLVQKYQANGVTKQFEVSLDEVPNLIASATVDESDVTVSGVVDNIVFLLVAPSKGSIVSVNTGFMYPVARLQSSNVRYGALFGHSVDTNRFGSDIVVGVPFEYTNIGDTPDIEGAVYRFVNEGQRYGKVTLVSPEVYSGTTLNVDGFVVSFMGTGKLSLTEVVSQINTETPTNIVAELSENSEDIVIHTMDRTADVVYNIMDVTMLPEVSNSNFGVTHYTNTQILRNFVGSSYSQFGYSVKMNERDGLIVSAVTENKKNQTTFDFTMDSKENDTIFDNDTTLFIDEVTTHGIVYQYEYLATANETIDNPGKYVFGQYITASTVDKSVEMPKFGSAIDYNNNTIVAGATKYKSSTEGGMTKFVMNTEHSAVYAAKKPVSVVDTSLLNSISMYDANTRELIDNLDFTDPIRGRLLGAIAINIDYTLISDPAVYSTDNGLTWLSNHVGDTWLDLNSVRVIDYNQPDVAYNTKYWGKVFPGSTADIYTWIESNNTPLNYVGKGFPVNYDQYNTTTIVDDKTNTLVNRYYFWVKNYTGIPKGKTLSPTVVSSYIVDPINSGISFIAPISESVIALYNCGNLMRGNTAVLHIGFGTSTGLGKKNTSWSLIKENSEEYLEGFPENTVGKNTPSNLYLKFIDSFRGCSQNSEALPDMSLPKLMRYGTGQRQSMFVNRLEALKVYLSYANNVMLQNPISEVRQLGALNDSDVTKYWNYASWWVSGFDDTVKTVATVNTYNDLKTFAANTTDIYNGMLLKVKGNIYGNSEYYSLDMTSGSYIWSRVGTDNGTIQFSNKLWTDSTVSTDSVYKIIRWVTEVLFKDELQDHRNKSLMLMFDYIQTENSLGNNSDEWLMKTSLGSVKYTIKTLLPHKKYKRDNYEFLQGYINEVKPFRVYIKDFTYAFNGLEPYSSTTTDFDLPSRLNDTTRTFVSPVITYSNDLMSLPYYSANNSIWNDIQYRDWFENYGLVLNESDIEVIDQGRGYTFIPKVTVTIDDANLPQPKRLVSVDPVINDGRVVDVTVNDIGKGYPAYPSFNVQGSNIAMSFSYINVYMDEEDSLAKMPNTIQVAGHPFIPGDIVKYSNLDKNSRKPTGLTEGMYYYVGVLAYDTIALYLTKEQALNASKSNLENSSASQLDPMRKADQHHDDGRITIAHNLGPSVSDPGYNRGDSYNNELRITARIRFSMMSAPMRSLKTVIKFDRCGYKSAITDWQSANEYVQGSSMVMYQGILYRCVTSNEDVEFDVLKWEKLYSSDPMLTALDRVKAFYKPTATMLGNVPEMLVSGIEYPNSIFRGERFALGWDGTPWDENRGWDAVLNDPDNDTELRSPPFPLTNTNTVDGNTGIFNSSFIKVGWYVNGDGITGYKQIKTATESSGVWTITIDDTDGSKFIANNEYEITEYPSYRDVMGGEFADGYGPEELVGGLISDRFSMVISEADTTLYTIDIDRFSKMYIKKPDGTLVPRKNHYIEWDTPPA
jgi:FG-GAP repeat